MKLITKMIRTALFGGTVVVLTSPAAFSQESEQQAPERTIKNSEIEQEAQQEDIERIEILGSKLIKDPTMTTRNISLYDRETIIKAGVSSLTEFFRLLPQNINGGSNVGAGVNPGNFGLGPNAYGASSVNLRGLGAQYTLILIDGRRPAPGGLFGDITDISTIPLERVDRIEIMYDGAAAIYGSDAVGGVVNIITRKDYAGTEVSVSYDVPKDDGGQALNFSIGHTVDLDGGMLSFSAGYSKEAEIAANQRDIDLLDVATRSLPVTSNGVVASYSEFRPEALMFVNDLNNDGDYDDPNERLAGGASFTYVDDAPWNPSGIGHLNISGLNGLPPWRVGDISRLTPEEQAQANAFLATDRSGYTPVYFANLPQYSGSELDLYGIPYNLPMGATPEQQFAALGQSNVDGSGQSLTPETESYSLSTNLQYELSENVDLGVNVDWTDKTQYITRAPVGYEQNIEASARSNPFDVVTTFAIDNGLPSSQNEVSSEVLNIALSLDWELKDGWLLSIDANRASTKNKSQFINTLLNGDTTVDANTSGLTEQQVRDNFVGTYASRLNGLGGIAYIPVGGTQDNALPILVEHSNVHFNDPLLGFSDLQAMKDGLFNPYYQTSTESVFQELELRLLATLLTLPGGDVTSSLVVARRETETRVDNQNSSEELQATQAIPGVRTEQFKRNIKPEINALGGEIAVPLVGKNNSFLGVNRFTLHGGFRIEDVNYFEKNAENWTLGFNYKPTEWATLRVNRADSTALPSMLLATGGVSFSAPTDMINTCNEFSTLPPHLCEVPIPENGLSNGRTPRIWQLGGSSDTLAAEKTKDTVVGLSFMDPNTHARLEFVYTDKSFEDQISTFALSSGINIGDLQAAESGINPFLRIIDEDTTVFGIPAAGVQFESSWGQVFQTQVGDYIFDQRNFNMRTTESETLDVNLTIPLELDNYGSLYLTWNHTKVLDYNLTQNSLCSSATVSCGPANGLTEAISILGETDRTNSGVFSTEAPIPEYTGSVQVNWGYKGLNVGLATQYAASTRIKNEARFPPTYEKQAFYIKSTPAIGLDISVNYELSGDLFDAPDWLDSTTVYFNVNDAFRRDEKIEVLFDDENAEEEIPSDLQEINTSMLRPRGTTFNLRFTTLF